MVSATVANTACCGLNVRLAIRAHMACVKSIVQSALIAFMGRKDMTASFAVAVLTRQSGASAHCAILVHTERGNNLVSSAVHAHMGVSRIPAKIAMVACTAA